MITNNSYFTGEIYIPHAKTDVSDSVLGARDSIDAFIDEYESECLLKTLGYSLNKLLQAKLDLKQTNGLKVGSDSKWNDLLNGKEYTVNGNVFYWKGIRYTNDSGRTYKSFLAYYVYFFYLRDYQSQFSNVGVQQSKPANAEVVSPRPKAVNSWNKFTNLIQGSWGSPTLIESNSGFGLDWYGSADDVSLYSFINDMNDVDDTTYPNFNPTMFNNMYELL